MDRNSELVTCEYQDCGAMKKSLPAHLRLKHGISVDQYKSWCKACDRDYDIGWTPVKGTKPPKVKAAKATKKIGALETGDDMLDSLDENEKEFYSSRYKTLWENSGEDPVLSATISQVVMNEIFIRRYQLQAQAMFRRPNVSQKDVGELHLTIDKIQGQTLNTLKSLNLTKEKRDLMNKSPESTPSRMVTSLALVCANMTPTERAKNDKDIEEAMARLREHTDELLLNTVSEDPNIPVETVEIG